MSSVRAPFAAVRASASCPVSVSAAAHAGVAGLAGKCPFAHRRLGKAGEPSLQTTSSAPTASFHTRAAPGYSPITAAVTGTHGAVTDPGTS